MGLVFTVILWMKSGWFPILKKCFMIKRLLALGYLETFQITHNDEFKQTAEKIFTYVLRDLTSPEGGFYSAEDADSEGEEGRFYVWTPKEINTVLGQELGELFCRFYNITPTGNFEPGLSIPHETTPAKAFAEHEGIGLTELKTNLEIAREKLFDAREKRIHPLKDDKIITSWNGLMIAAFAKGYQVFGEQRYADAARKSARFILKKLRNPEGRILRRFREKEVAFPGYLEDYAFLLGASLSSMKLLLRLTILKRQLSLIMI